MPSFQNDCSTDSQKIIFSQKRKRRSHPLEWLVTHKNPKTGQSYLENYHMHIGESFMQDMLSLQGHYKRQSWEEYIDKNSSQSNNFIDIKIAARKRIYHALQMLGEKQKIIIDLCLLGKKLSDTEKKFGLRQGKAKDILRQGLESIRAIYT